MERMTLARALRYKKRVVETIRNLETDVQTYNSMVEGSDRDIDVREALRKRAAWVKHLVDLKLEIQRATAPVQRLVLELAETKSEIVFLGRLNVTNGLSLYNSFGDSQIKYEAVVRKTERDAALKGLQERIDRLQTGIDEHNASTMITVMSPELETV